MIGGVSNVIRFQAKIKDIADEKSLFFGYSETQTPQVIKKNF